MGKVTALKIKHAVMCYFRFDRQWLCASECLNSDVLAITDKGIIEVEIKISKYDLWKGEAKKDKHKFPPQHWGYYSNPNKFYICVPYDLLEEAKKWVEVTNKKYGIIQHYDKAHYSCSISVVKKAQAIHSEPAKILEGKIMMRVCSENIGLLGRLLEKEL